MPSRAQNIAPLQVANPTYYQTRTKTKDFKEVEILKVLIYK